MEYRRERRALPASPHIGGPKIPDDGYAKAVGQVLTSADLHSERARRIVVDGLTVKANIVEVVSDSRLLLQEALDRFGMPTGDKRLCLGERSGPGLAAGERRRIAGGLVQQFPVGL
jgi:hypothetical protein